jgi:hypothetical protein
MRAITANELMVVNGGAPAGEGKLDTLAQGFAVGAAANAVVGDEPGALLLCAAALGIKAGEALYAAL